MSSEPIYRFLSEDHRGLSSLLERSMSPGGINPAAYAEFPCGFTQAHRYGRKNFAPCRATAARRRATPYCGWITELLPRFSCPRRPAIVAALRTILSAHNPIEEGADGLYEQCENLAGAEAEQILQQLRSAPEVKVAPHTDAPKVIEATRRAVVKAAYNVKVVKAPELL